MDTMHAITIVDAATKGDYRHGLLAACRCLLVSGLAADLPSRYGRLIYTIMTSSPFTCGAIDEKEEARNSE